MGDEEILISGIEYKVRKLIEELKKEKADNIRLAEENKELKDRIITRERTIEEFEQKINILKTAKSLDTTKGSDEAKQRINELVREIDQCIAFLNY